MGPPAETRSPSPTASRRLLSCHPNTDGAPTSAGVVTDNGDGLGQLDFVFGNVSLAGITDLDANYYATAKVILTNGNAYTLTQYPVKGLRTGLRRASSAER